MKGRGGNKDLNKSENLNVCTEEKRMEPLTKIQ